MFLNGEVTVGVRMPAKHFAPQDLAHPLRIQDSATVQQLEAAGLAKAVVAQLEQAQPARGGERDAELLGGLLGGLSGAVDGAHAHAVLAELVRGQGVLLLERALLALRDEQPRHVVEHRRAAVDRLGRAELLERRERDRGRAAALVASASAPPRPRRKNPLAATDRAKKPMLLRATWGNTRL